jgi:hypothetical protein
MGGFTVCAKPAGGVCWAGGQQAAWRSKQAAPWLHELREGFIAAVPLLLVPQISCCYCCIASLLRASISRLQVTPALSPAGCTWRCGLGHDAHDTFTWRSCLAMACSACGPACIRLCVPSYASAHCSTRFHVATDCCMPGRVMASQNMHWLSSAAPAHDRFHAV